MSTKKKRCIFSIYYLVIDKTINVDKNFNIKIHIKVNNKKCVHSYFIQNLYTKNISDGINVLHDIFMMIFEYDNS